MSRQSWRRRRRRGEKKEEEVGSWREGRKVVEEMGEVWDKEEKVKKRTD